MLPGKRPPTHRIINPLHNMDFPAAEISSSPARFRQDSQMLPSPLEASSSILALRLHYTLLESRLQEVAQEKAILATTLAAVDIDPRKHKGAQRLKGEENQIQRILDSLDTAIRLLELARRRRLTDLRPTGSEASEVLSMKTSRKSNKDDLMGQMQQVYADFLELDEPCNSPASPAQQRRSFKRQDQIEDQTSWRSSDITIVSHTTPQDQDGSLSLSRRPSYPEFSYKLFGPTGHLEPEVDFAGAWAVPELRRSAARCVDSLDDEWLDSSDETGQPIGSSEADDINVYSLSSERESTGLDQHEFEDSERPTSAKSYGHRSSSNSTVYDERPGGRLQRSMSRLGNFFSRGDSTLTSTATSM